MGKKETDAQHSPRSFVLIGSRCGCGAVSRSAPFSAPRAARLHSDQNKTLGVTLGAARISPTRTDRGDFGAWIFSPTPNLARPAVRVQPQVRSAAQGSPAVDRRIWMTRRAALRRSRLCGFAALTKQRPPKQDRHRKRAGLTSGYTPMKPAAPFGLDDATPQTLLPPRAYLGTWMAILIGGVFVPTDFLLKKLCIPASCQPA